MLIESITIGTVFAFALPLAMLLGRLFRVELKAGRYTHLDGLRALAALMVVCSHYLTHVSLITGDPANARLVDALGAVGVQIFFCITGFLFARKQRDVGELIVSRVRRIAPLYVVAITAAIAIAVYMARIAGKVDPITGAELLRAYAYGFFVSPVPSVAGLSIGGQAGQMWTLAWEWRFYAFVPFIGFLIARRAWGVAALAFAAGCLIIDYPLYGSVPPWAFFIPGIACAVVEKRATFGTLWQIVLSAIGIGAYLAALAIGGPVNGIERSLLCLVGFVGVMFGHRALLSARPLRLLGEVSYSIYMLHLIVASLFWSYVQGPSHYLQYQTPDEKLPLALLALAGLFVISFASYAFVERPFMRQAATGDESAPSTRAIA